MFDKGQKALLLLALVAAIVAIVCFSLAATAHADEYPPVVPGATVVVHTPEESWALHWYRQAWTNLWNLNVVRFNHHKHLVVMPEVITAGPIAMGKFYRQLAFFYLSEIKRIRGR